MRLGRKLASIDVRGSHGPGGHLVGAHKGEEANQDGRSVPAWLPGVGVVVTHRSADLGVGCEAATWCLHLDAGWLEGELGRKKELTMVLASRVGCVGRATQDVMPVPR